MSVRLVPFIGFWRAFLSRHRGTLKVNAVLFANLLLGLGVAFIVPRLAIERLGEAGYGLFALIVGFAGLLAFADLGLQPGLTRALAVPLSRGETARILALVRPIAARSIPVWLLLSLASYVLVWPAVEKNGAVALYAVAIFAVTSLAMTVADLVSSVLRAGGRLVTSYWLRTTYLLCYLLLVIAVYALVRDWADATTLLFAQAIATGLWLAAVLLATRIWLSKIDSASGTKATTENVDRLWRDAWRTSNPERFNRVVQMISAAVERPLLFATAGAAVVTSYDLLQRIGMLASVLPATLSQPLLAMVAYDGARAGQRLAFPGAERFTRVATLILASTGVILSLGLWLFGHRVVFGVDSTLPTWLGVLVLVTIGINVLTAPVVAVLLANGNVRAVNVKVGIEAAGVATAVAIALHFGNAILFIAVRNVSIACAACFLLWRDMAIRQRGNS